MSPLAKLLLRLARRRMLRALDPDERALFLRYGPQLFLLPSVCCYDRREQMAGGVYITLVGLMERGLWRMRMN